MSSIHGPTWQVLIFEDWHIRLLLFSQKEQFWKFKFQGRPKFWVVGMSKRATMVVKREEKMMKQDGFWSVRVWHSLPGHPEWNATWWFPKKAIESWLFDPTLALFTRHASRVLTSACRSRGSFWAILVNPTHKGSEGPFPSLPVVLVSKSLTYYYTARCTLSGPFDDF